MTDDEQVVVLDCGSRNTKAGFAGDENPKAIFPTIFGHLKNGKDKLEFESGNTYIGDEVQRKSGDFFIKYPIEHGIFRNLEDIDKLFHFIFFDELRFDPKDHSVLLIEPPKNPRFLREKQTEIMFETYNTSAFCVRKSSLLALFASGRNTGIILNVGEGVSYVDPFYDGFSIIRGVKRQNFGGSNLNEYLEDLLLCEQGITFDTTSDREILRDIKEKKCYVSLDFESELKKSKNSSETESSYFYSDGRELKISNERFRCPELLFKPNLNGFEFKGIHDLVFDSVMNCDINTRADLFTNIILSGGSTMITGLPERLDKEMKNLVPSRIRSKIIAPEYRWLNEWIGGSILGSLSTYPQMSVSREEYKENGKDAINKKCF